MLANVREVEFPTRGDDRGRLVIQESTYDLVLFENQTNVFNTL